MSEARLANPVNCVKIICLETLEVFDSISEASRVKNCNRNAISNCLSGRAKSSGGYHWMYYEDYLEQQNNENLEQDICINV